MNRLLNINTIKGLGLIFILVNNYNTLTAQEQTNTTSEIQISNSAGKQSENTIRVTNPNHHPKNGTIERERTLEMVNYEIYAIKDKMDYVKNDEQLDKKAKEIGWYTEMKNRLKELENEQKSFSSN